jgi:hypothetical protein
VAAKVAADLLPLPEIGQKKTRHFPPIKSDLSTKVIIIFNQSERSWITNVKLDQTRQIEIRLDFVYLGSRSPGSR